MDQILDDESFLDAILSIIVEPSRKSPDRSPQITGLPQPSFRLIPERQYKLRTYTASKSKSEDSYTKDGYYHYIEPSPEDLMERVEYDMDKHDEKWLQEFNNNKASVYGYKVSDDDFEKIMDRLEKEAYFQSKKSGKEVVREIDNEAVCAICDDGESQIPNSILFCDMCDLAVHQECYGVPYIPEGQWLCRRCLHSPSANVSCVFCPNKGGAFKKTDDNRWAHVICALWIPEVAFANTVFLEPIDGIEQIPLARWRLTCYICKQKKKGACIQCHKPNCYVPFHVTCAQQAGLYLKIRNSRGSHPDDLQREAFCDAHGPSNGHYKKGMYISESDTEEISIKESKKRKYRRRDNMNKTRKILAEKREKAFNPTAEPDVREDKLIEISQLLNFTSTGRKSGLSDEAKRELIGHIKGYWILKRKARNGVPLLRRLQVSYNNTISKETVNNKTTELDADVYTDLRYNLERARLLVGEVKKRESLKKRLFRMSRDLADLKYKAIDKQRPVLEE